MSLEADVAKFTDNVNGVSTRCAYITYALCLRVYTPLLVVAARVKVFPGYERRNPRIDTSEYRFVAKPLACVMRLGSPSSRKS